MIIYERRQPYVSCAAGKRKVSPWKHPSCHSMPVGTWQAKDSALV